MQNLVHDVSLPVQALCVLCILQCSVLEVGVHNLVQYVSQLVQALSGLCIFQCLVLVVDECSHDHRVPRWSISVVKKCRLFLNLGVFCYSFGTPVRAHVVRQQDVQRGGAQSHERVRRSLHNKQQHSCLPKLWETVWGKTHKI